MPPRMLIGWVNARAAPWEARDTPQPPQRHHQPQQTRRPRQRRPLLVRADYSPHRTRATFGRDTASSPQLLHPPPSSSVEAQAPHQRRPTSLHVVDPAAPGARTTPLPKGTDRAMPCPGGMGDPCHRQLRTSFPRLSPLATVREKEGLAVALKVPSPPPGGADTGGREGGCLPWSTVKVYTNGNKNLKVLKDPKHVRSNIMEKNIIRKVTMSSSFRSTCNKVTCSFRIMIWPMLSAVS